MALRLVLTGLVGVFLALVNVQRATKTPDLDYQWNEKVSIEGIISDEPDRRPMHTKYTIGHLLVSDHSGYPQYKYGDTVRISGKIEQPGVIDDFNYANYLGRYGIYAVIYRAQVEKVHDGPPSFFRTLYSIKDRFEAQTNKLYAEPHASFMAGLLTGSRKGIPDHLMQKFNETGLTHIIAISGYNITIVIAVISGLLFWLPLRKRFFPAIAAIIIFTLFVGASAAVVRAAIMGILGLLALQTGKLTHVRLSILWTMFVMVLWNPKYLWYDAGFQLSFLAVIGLAELAPLLTTWFKRIPQALGIREALQMTVAAQISTAPLILLLFGRVSLVSPIANVLVAPVIPFAMLFGFLGTVVSFFWFFGGQLLAYVGWGCLSWIIFVASSLSKLPHIHP